MRGGLLAEGHVLLDDVPGTGKTTLAENGLRAASHESLRAFERRVESARVLPGFAQATEAHLAERCGGQALDAGARAPGGAARRPAVRSARAGLIAPAPPRT